jgi:hypothetical protein
MVRVMQGDPQELLEAAGEAVRRASRRVGGVLGGAVVFDCVSRYLALDEEFPKELHAVQDALGADVPLLGCLAFGEVGAFATEVPQFHNKSVLALALGAG